MEKSLETMLKNVANTIRQLSFEAVQKANSGHPGLPMGCAELGAYLYGQYLKHNPENPNWMNRDRMILSAGHGSMWLYSGLHLSGFDVSMEDLQSFRQLHSKTPGHPEYGETPGVEATTGPLGQGVGNAVGQALGLKILGSIFNKKGSEKILNPKVICLAGDGCLMEGVSNEVSSFAGHLILDNLIVIHDANKITLDGTLDQSSSEDVKARYHAYGFDVYEMDGHDFHSIDEVMTKIRNHQTRPVYIECHTIIGKGSPNKANSYKAHGSPLGEDEVVATKQALGLPDTPFYVSDDVRAFFKEHKLEGVNLEKQWIIAFDKWKNDNPDLAKKYIDMNERVIPASLEKTLNAMAFDKDISGRKASQAVLQELGKELPFLYGGSADLSGSDCTMMNDFPLIAPGHFEGRNIKYGIREFGMTTIASGLFQTGMILPYIGTFFTFSDYLRNACRLACLSKYHVIYQFTHDSVLLGEDGPTHQPVEHLASLRAMPHLHVFRPADAHEVKGAWLSALQYPYPSAIVLSRQNLPVLKETEVSHQKGVSRGAYIIKKEKSQCDYCLFATGSEVSLALEVAHALEVKGKHVRVVSMPCWELFNEQDKSYQDQILAGDLGKRVSIEAGSSFGWHRFVGHDGITIAVDQFGLSAPVKDIVNELGFTVDAILERIL